jgi:hypothetical protein
MYSNSGTLYPMLGVGSFVTMFWTGVVVGYELGLGCMPLLILGLLCGCIATVGVCELQRRDGHGLGADSHGAGARPSAHAESTDRGTTTGSLVGVGGRVPLGTTGSV